MKKNLLAIVAIAALMMVLGLAACSSNSTPSDDSSKPSDEPAAPAIDGSAYGYAGDDPIEFAVYKYLCEEMSTFYAEGDVTIPVVNIVAEDLTNLDEVIVYGDFWVFNYTIEGDTLVTASGGNCPGVMHLTRDGDGYVVSTFDRVADGAGYAESVKELFGEFAEDYSAAHSNAEDRAERRTITISDYVNLNGLDITQYQDPAQDPVKLYK